MTPQTEFRAALGDYLRGVSESGTDSTISLTFFDPAQDQGVGGYDWQLLNVDGGVGKAIDRVMDLVDDDDCVIRVMTLDVGGFTDRNDVDDYVASIADHCSDTGIPSVMYIPEGTPEENCYGETVAKTVIRGG